MFGSLLVRFVKTGEPVATLSLRRSRLNSDAGAPTWPSPTYIRVLPFWRRVTAMSGLVVAIAWFSDGLICVHVDPLSRSSARRRERTRPR